MIRIIHIVAQVLTSLLLCQLMFSILPMTSLILAHSLSLTAWNLFFKKRELIGTYGGLSWLLWGASFGVLFFMMLIGCSDLIGIFFDIY